MKSSERVQQWRKENAEYLKECDKERWQFEKRKRKEASYVKAMRLKYCVKGRA